MTTSIETLNELDDGAVSRVKINNSLESLRDNKVEKVSGKELSANDFTDTLKTKLDGVATGANNYVLPTDVVQDSSYVKTDNNYTDAEKTKLSGIASGSEVNVTDNVYGGDNITVNKVGKDVYINGVAGSGEGNDGAFEYFTTTATSGQTLITLPFTYVTGNNNLIVVVNGDIQAIGNYTESSTTTITFTGGLTVGDTVFVYYLAKGMVYRGDYSGIYDYKINDTVTYGGTLYTCIADSTGNLPTNATYFTVLVDIAGMVTETGTQTLTNKTLTAPVINNPTGLDSNDVGLANVDNTSDLLKPISTATQNAINLKADISNVIEKDSTTAYTPTTQYHPANKKYVDEQIIDSGSGDVVGPAGAVDTNIAVYDGTTGKIITDSGSKTTDFALVPVTGKETAIASQTVFTVPTYTAGRIQVYINGDLQIVTDNYTETNSTTITMTGGLTAGDVFNYIIL